MLATRIGGTGTVSILLQVEMSIDLRHAYEEHLRAAAARSSGALRKRLVKLLTEEVDASELALMLLGERFRFVELNNRLLCSVSASGFVGEAASKEELP